jgi:hypothetical protein
LSDKVHQGAQEGGAAAEKRTGAVPDRFDVASLARQIRQPGPAPVHLWDPPYCGEMDLRIARDGNWIHEGRPIRREALVRLLSSVLKREGDRYYLVTPAEKVGIQVEDCPFVAQLAEVHGAGPDQRIVLALNNGESVTIDHDHPLRVAVAPGSDEPHPVVPVRAGLDALLSRSVFYQLVALAQVRDDSPDGPLGIWSGGCFFPLE